MAVAVLGTKIMTRKETVAIRTVFTMLVMNNMTREMATMITKMRTTMETAEMTRVKPMVVAPVTRPVPRRAGMVTGIIIALMTGAIQLVRHGAASIGTTKGPYKRQRKRQEVYKHVRQQKPATNLETKITLQVMTRPRMRAQTSVQKNRRQKLNETWNNSV